MIRPLGKRFADRLAHLRLPLGCADDPRQRAAVAGARAAVDAMPIVAVDNAAALAADQVAADPRAAAMLCGDAAFPPPAYTSPFRECWLEYAVPPAWCGPRQRARYCGAIVHRRDVDNAEVRRTVDANRDAFERQGVRWLIGLDVFETSDGMVRWLGCPMATVDASGVHCELLFPRAEQPASDETLTILCMPFVLGMGFLCCSNVEVRDVLPSALEQREQARKRRSPLHAYKVLVVRSVGRRRSAEGKAGPGGNAPLHICRGHFARYGPAFGRGLLFGRLAGQFWIDEHERGDRANGTVAKDYRVPEMSDEEYSGAPTAVAENVGNSERLTAS